MAVDGECGHECEVTQADLNDLRYELTDRIEDLQRLIDDLRD